MIRDYSKSLADLSLVLLDQSMRHSPERLMDSFPGNRLSRAETTHSLSDVDGVLRARASVYASVDLARSEIWSSDVREELAVPKYTKYDLDKRREKV